MVSKYSLQNLFSLTRQPRACWTTPCRVLGRSVTNIVGLSPTSRLSDLPALLVCLLLPCCLRRKLLSARMLVRFQDAGLDTSITYTYSGCGGDLLLCCRIYCGKCSGREHLSACCVCGQVVTPVRSAEDVCLCVRGTRCTYSSGRETL